MSHAPVEASDYRGEELAYAKATDELNKQVDDGTPWSGSERNQVFLNLGKIGSDQATEFADVSAIAGFDFPDDSRGLTSLDWDLDGDLDFITTNRTAPRVRIFENQFEKGHTTSLSIKLIGTITNRDAIGSRVELLLQPEKGEPITLHRTLTAGHGFLSQASKWIHFGIPPGAQIQSCSVIWNGKAKETFSGLALGKNHLLTEGDGKAVIWNPPFKAEIPQASGQELEQLSPTSIAHLERPLPFPTLPCFDQEGKATELYYSGTQPIFLNLWASWCPDCAAELDEFAKHQAAFKKAGVQLITLCVDLDPTNPQDRAKALKILAEKNISSRTLFVAPKTLDFIHLAHNTTFVRPDQLPAPSSLLISADGHLRTVLRGQAATKDFLASLEALTFAVDRWKTFAQPAEGPWLYGADVIAYSGVAKEMIERGWLSEAGQYLLSNQESLSADGQTYPQLLMLAGTRFLEKDFSSRGIRLLQAAVEAAPELAVARNNLAVALLQAGREQEAAPHLEAALKIDPNFLNARINLARYHVNSRDPKSAADLIAPVLAKGYHPKAIRIHAQILISQGKTAELLNVFQEIAGQEPKEPSSWVNLGKLQQQIGQSANALISFQKAVQLAPSNPQLQDIVEQLRESLKQN